MTRKIAALIAAALLGLGLGLLVTGSSANASTVGCSIDFDPDWDFEPEGDGWLTPSYRASGCGEVTLRWEGWFGTKDECAIFRLRTYNNGEWVNRPWIGPLCGIGNLAELKANVSDNRLVRAEVRHFDFDFRNRTHAPSYGVLYY
jgi:hypothetical protein